MKKRVSLLALPVMLAALALIFTGCPNGEGDIDNGNGSDLGGGTYRVVFDVNYDGGSSPASIDVPVGEAAGVDLWPTSPSRGDEWRFDGWYSADGIQYHAFIPILGDVELVARWTRMWLVTFDSGFETEEEAYTRRIADGAFFVYFFPPPGTNPDEDLTFVGWYTEADDGVRFTNTMPVTNDLTLMARWRMVWIVNIVGMPGSPNLEIFAVRGEPLGDDFPEDPVLPATVGGRLNFGGWFEGRNGQIEFTRDTPITGNVELHARFRGEGVEYVSSAGSNAPVYVFDISGHRLADFDYVSLRILVTVNAGGRLRMWGTYEYWIFDPESAMFPRGRTFGNDEPYGGAENLQSNNLITLGVADGLTWLSPAQHWVWHEFRMPLRGSRDPRYQYTHTEWGTFWDDDLTGHIIFGLGIIGLAGAPISDLRHYYIADIRIENTDGSVSVPAIMDPNNLPDELQEWWEGLGGELYIGYTNRSEAIDVFLPGGPIVRRR